MSAQLTVTLTPEGQVEVSGNVDNKVLVLGLLEAAKGAVLAALAGPPPAVQATTEEAMRHLLSERLRAGRNGGQ